MTTRLVYWLVDRYLTGWLVGLLVGWLAHGLVGLSVGGLDGWWVGWLVVDWYGHVCMVDCFVGLLVDWLTVWLVVGWLVGCADLYLPWTSRWCFVFSSSCFSLNFRNKIDISHCYCSKSSSHHV